MRSPGPVRGAVLFGVVAYGVLKALPLLLMTTALFLLQGCGGERTAGKTVQAGEAPESAAPNPMTLSGIGGDVELGASLDDAKRAFPMPEGASPTPKPEVTFEGQEHWGWESGTAVFDAFAGNAKLEWFSLSRKLKDPADRADEVNEDVAEFGPPKERAKSRSSEALIWEVDDGVRLVLNLGAGASPGVVRIVGYRQVLQEIGMPTADLKSFVESLDLGAGK